jgi:prolyl-tRNA synthetase
MKDLYTFDSSVDAALKTYDEVRTSYASIFSDMKLPVLAAKASSGDMGGDLSHEYHLPTPLGEDRVVSCDSCGYVVNEEIADSAVSLRVLEGTPIQAWRGITKDRTKLVNVWYPRSMQSLDGISREYADHDINLLAVKSVAPDLDSGVEDTLSLWATATASETGTAKEVVNIVDSRLPHPLPKTLESNSSTVFGWPTALPPPALPLSTSSHRTNGLLRVRTGDKCPQCSSGTLKVERAIELGHTFFLGTRYSEPLRAMVTLPPATQAVPIQMGCHGIGISRVIGAVAEHLADKIGLNWPISIAPYSCVVIAGKDADDADAVQVCGRITNTQGNESLSLDVVLDDRSRPLPWKLTDADLIGFPIIVVLGREWAAARRVEVQCRRLSMKEGVELEDLPHLIRQLHALL